RRRLRPGRRRSDARDLYRQARARTDPVGQLAEAEVPRPLPALGDLLAVAVRHLHATELDAVLFGAFRSLERDRDGPDGACVRRLETCRLAREGLLAGASLDSGHGEDREGT